MSIPSLRSALALPTPSSRRSPQTQHLRLPRLPLAVALVGLLLVGCEGGGPTEPSSTAPPTTTAAPARITFWTSDSSPSPIAVTVNGQRVGTLTMWRTGAPACGAPTTGGTLTVDVPAGTHAVAGYETEGAGVWTARNVTLQAGGCLVFHFTP
jgi:hypothetical protein